MGTPAIRRVSVVGCSGAGKSTLSAALARALDADHVELDAIFHQPGWTPLDRDVLRARVGERLEGERWVVDGNYQSQVQDLVWPLVDTIVWLDLPRSVVMRSIIGRTLRRIGTGEELWNGNRERWWNLVDPRPKDNIILWAWTRHGPYRSKYAAQLDDAAWAHVTWVRLRSRDEVAAFLDGVRAN